MDVNKKLPINAGVVLTLLLAIIPMYAWKISYPIPETELWRVIAFSFAKVSAFGGMSMFALSLILSGRYKWYDSLFGGLDKMYIMHRFLGTFSLLLLTIHPLSLTILRLDQGAGEAASLWFNVSDFGVWLGSLAFYLLLGLVLWSIYGRARYETFVKVHRLLGVVFIAGAIHAFASGSILAVDVFTFWYLLVLTIAGVVTYVTYSVLGDLMHRPLAYTVADKIQHKGDVVELHLAPKRRIINFTPGQFVYVEFDDLKSHGYHPFSISSAKKSSTLVLAVRKSGDFTNALADIKKGAQLRVKGPYGRFMLQARSKEKQLWIAGGIGVTPFVSGALSLRPSSRSATGNIEMIYASADKTPYGLPELQAAEDHNDSFNVTLVDQETFGFVSFAMLESHIKDLAERKIYICGPPIMLKNLRDEAASLGFEHNLHFEEFSY